MSRIQLTVACVATLLGAAACSTKAPRQAAPVVRATASARASVSARAPVPKSSPAPSASPSSASPSPSRTTAAPATPVSATPAPSLAPTRAPLPSLHTPAPAYVSSDPRPHILDVHLSSTVFVGGDMVSGIVRTSSNVASVEARIATYSIGVPKIGEGTFRLTYRVPSLPFFLQGNYTMIVIARNTRGDRVERSIPIQVR